MKFKSIRFFFIVSIIGLFSACNWLNTTTTVSSNPYFVSLTFGANDSIPNINSAVFTLEYDTLLHDSVIVNLDSLPYQTRIDSVFPTFSFQSSAVAYLIFENPADTVTVTGTDTIDFSHSVKVRNYASDHIAYKDYPIKVNVHKVEPELYVWKKINEGITSNTGSAQKAILFNNTFFFYINNGVKNYLYTSPDGTNWSSATITGLPLFNPLKYMIQFNGKLYLIDDIGTSIYTSTDGSNWTKTDYSAKDYKFKALLYSLNSKLWAITQSKSDGSYHFSNTTDGTFGDEGELIPDNFPIGDFAAISFFSRTGKARALVIGGYTSNGDLLKSSWSTEDGSYWINFSSENATLDSLEAGASIISYDKKLLLFGGKYRDNVLMDDYLVSIDEGLSWSTPDTLYNRLREPIINGTDTTYINYEPRTYQSVIVQNPNLSDKSSNANRIYIIGGQTRNQIFTDVWTGKLNRLNFLR